MPLLLMTNRPTSLGLWAWFFPLILGCTPITPPEWKNPSRKQVDGLTVVTPGDAEQIDRVVEVWREVLHDVERSPVSVLAKDPLPLTVYVFGNDDEWARFRRRCSKPDNCPAFYEYPACRVFLSDTSSRGTLRHEMIHHLHHSKVGLSVVPWLDEGLAEYFEGESDDLRQFSSWVELLTGQGERPPHEAPRLLDWVLSRSESEMDSTIARIYAELLVRLLATHPSLAPHFAEYVLQKASPRDRLPQLCTAFSIRQDQLGSLYQDTIREEFKRFLPK